MSVLVILYVVGMLATTLAVMKIDQRGGITLNSAEFVGLLISMALGWWFMAAGFVFIGFAYALDWVLPKLLKVRN